jgi:hypothetical protein
MKTITMPAELAGAEPTAKVMETLRTAAKGDDAALHMASELGIRHLNATHRGALFAHVEQLLRDSKAQPVSKIVAQDFHEIGEAAGEVHCVLNMAASGSDGAKRLAGVVGSQLPEAHRLKLIKHVETLLENHRA